MTICSLVSMLLLGLSPGVQQSAFDSLRDFPAMWRAVSYMNEPKRLEGDWKLARIERKGASYYNFGNNISFFASRFEESDIFPLQHLRIDSAKSGPKSSDSILQYCDP